MWKFLAAILVSAATVVFVSRLVRNTVGPTSDKRLETTWGLLSGFVVGHVFLFRSATFWPERNWHCLPVLLLIATLPHLWGSQSWFRGGFRIIYWALATGITAWTLVPAWDDLYPSRWVQVATLGLIMGGLLSYQLRPILLPVPLAVQIGGVISWIGLATLIALSVSLVFAQLGALVAACAMGCLIADTLDRRGTGSALANAWHVLVLLGVAVAYIATIETDPPHWGLLGLALVPTLAGCMVPISDSNPRRATWMSLSVQLVIMALLAWLILRS